MGAFILFLIDTALSLVSFVIIAWVVLSWLVAFDVINLRHPMMNQFWRFLDTSVSWLMRPLRRFIPIVAGFDFTPFVALILIQGIRGYLLPWIFRPIIGALGG
jgi:YggT family protein